MWFYLGKPMVQACQFHCLPNQWKAYIWNEPHALTAIHFKYFHDIVQLNSLKYHFNVPNKVIVYIILQKTRCLGWLIVFSVLLQSNTWFIMWVNYFCSNTLKLLIKPLPLRSKAISFVNLVVFVLFWTGLLCVNCIHVAMSRCNLVVCLFWLISFAL